MEDFGITESPIGVNDPSPRYDPGSLYYHNGAFFRYVKFIDAVAYAVGDVCEWAAANFSAVSNDRAGGSSLGRMPAGVCLAAMTQNNYGFVQVAGTNTTRIYTDAGVAAGDWLVSHTVDGECDTMAAGEEAQVFAFATAADTGDYIAAGDAVIKGLL